MHLGKRVIPRAESSGCSGKVAGREEEQAAGLEKPAEAFQHRDGIGDVFDDFDGGHDVEGAVVRGEFSFGQNRQATGAGFFSPRAGVKAENLVPAEAANEADEATVAAAEVEPLAGCGVEVADSVDDAAPLVAANRGVGVFKLERVVDKRIGALAGIVGVIVNLRVGPRFTM